MKKTIKKITTESAPAKLKPVPIKSGPVKTDQEEKQPPRKRGCVYCLNERSSSTNRQLPSYTDMATLKRFLSDRSKILPKAYTHLCSKHQRAVTKNIKYARHLALLPFTPKV